MFYFKTVTLIVISVFHAFMILCQEIISSLKTLFNSVFPISDAIFRKEKKEKKKDFAPKTTFEICQEPQKSEICSLTIWKAMLGTPPLCGAYIISSLWEELPGRTVKSEDTVSLSRVKLLRILLLTQILQTFHVSRDSSGYFSCLPCAYQILPLRKHGPESYEIVMHCNSNITLHSSY